MYICSQPTQVTFSLGGATGTLSCGGAGGCVRSIRPAALRHIGQQPYGQQPYTGQQPTANRSRTRRARAAPYAERRQRQQQQLARQHPGLAEQRDLRQPGHVSVSARGPDGQADQQGNVNLYTTSGAIEPKNGTITNGKFDM